MKSIMEALKLKYNFNFKVLKRIQMANKCEIPILEHLIYSLFDQNVRFALSFS